MIEFHTEQDLVEPGRGPDLTPLIDMVFLLLVFFLLTSFVIQPSVDVALPETSYGEIDEPAPITITVRMDGTLLLNGENVSADTLPSRLQSFGEHLQQEVIIQADRRVAFGRVVQIMDLCKKAGTEEVSFLVEQRMDE